MSFFVHKWQLTVTNTYEATRNVLQQKRNTAGDLSQITNTPISNFVYTVNDLGQRDDVSRSGSAFASASAGDGNGVLVHNPA